MGVHNVFLNSMPNMGCSNSKPQAVHRPAQTSACYCHTMDGYVMNGVRNYRYERIHFYKDIMYVVYHHNPFLPVKYLPTFNPRSLYDF
jgi:hypothetical protein